MFFSNLTLRRFRTDAKLLIIVSGIFAVSFFGVQMLLQILYLLRLGYDLPYIGIFNATGSLTYMVMSFLCGVSGTYISNRTNMLGGGIVTILGMATLPFTEFVPTSWHDWFPLLAQFLISGGWAFFSISQVPALMAAATSEDRNLAFALSSTFRGMGTFVGTIFGGLLPSFFAYLLTESVDNPEPYRYSLLVGAVLGLAGLLPILRMERTESPRQQAQASTGGNDAFPILAMALLILHVYLGNSSSALCQNFCSAYMDTDLRLSTASIGLLTGIGQFVAILAPLLVAGIVQRRGNSWIMMVTTAGAALSLLPMIYIHNWFGAGLGRLGTLTLAAIWMPALQIYQMELVPPRWRTLAYSILSMGMSLTFTSISLAGGYIATHWGYQSLFSLGIVTSLLGSLLMAVMGSRMKREGVKRVA